MAQENQPARHVSPHHDAPDTKSQGVTGRQRKRLHVLIAKQMLALAASGFGLVAALAWNSVIQEFVATRIKPYLPSGSGLISLAIYAVIVTVIAVTVTYQLTKLIDKLEK